MYVEFQKDYDNLCSYYDTIMYSVITYLWIIMY